MLKKHIPIILSLLILLALVGGQHLTGEAAPWPDPGSLSLIDSEVWEALAASPPREVTIVVSLRPAGGGGPEQAIDAQFRLEMMLDLLAETGGLRDYQSFYGANIIKITGGLGMLRLLEDWPELESASLYQPGEAWELQMASTVRSAQVNGTGLIIGTVTASDGVTLLEGIRVTAYRHITGTTWEVAGTAHTNASGDYVVSGLGTGIYRARFEDPAGNYVTQFFDNKPTFTLATNFDVTDGQVTPNINAAMALAGKISGTVTKAEGGGALKDFVVSAFTFVAGNSHFVSNAVSASDGVYTIGGLPPGTYRVRFEDINIPPNYLTQWYDGQLVVEDAQDIPVTAGTTVTGINAAMGLYGSITGNIKADDGVTNLAGIVVTAYRASVTYWEWVSFGETDPSGNYVVSGLSSGNYRLEFSDALGQFTTEFYENKPDIGSADDIWVNLGYATEDINAQLSLKTNAGTRNLVDGWNLISLPVTLADPSTPVAFESISGSYNEIFAYDACDTSVPYDPWKLYTPDLPPDHPANDLTEVNVKMGYWIKLSSQATLAFSGVHPLTTSINLCPGWNLVGYPSLAVRPVEEALASITGQYTLVRQYRAGESTLWKTYSPTAPPMLNTLKNLEPGYGYWIYMTQAATLVITGR